jgi:hypothetical protein
MPGDQHKHWLGVAWGAGHRTQDIDGRQLVFDPFAIFDVALG